MLISRIRLFSNKLPTRLCKLLFITTPRTSKFLQASIYSMQAEIRFMKSHKSMTHTTKYLQIQTAIKFCTGTEEEVKPKLKCAWLIRNESWNYIVIKLETISPPILQWQSDLKKNPIKSITQLGLQEPGNIKDTVLGELKHNRIGYSFFTVWEVRLWNRLSREAMGVPSLQVLKAKLDVALSNLVHWKVSLPMAGGLD